MPESRNATGRLSIGTKKLVEGRCGRLPVLFRPPRRAGGAGVQGKPVAEIRPFPVAGGIGGGLGLPTFAGSAGAVETAVPAGTDIPAAGSALKGTAHGFGRAYGRAAIPAHTAILPGIRRCGNIAHRLALILTLAGIYARPLIYLFPRLDYNGTMFVVTPCAAGCGRPAVSGSNTCAIHAADARGEAERIGDYITGHDVIKDLSACGLRFEGMDFSRRAFFGCNFSGASFSMCLFTKCRMRILFFDFCTFKNCDFSGSDLEFLSFAGSSISDCTFEGSNLIHINYSGSVITETTFDNSDLYNSRFIKADIAHSDFENCNLKRNYFIKTRQEAVSFKASNAADMIFEIEE
jgi:hypothetical protein